MDEFPLEFRLAVGVTIQEWQANLKCRNKLELYGRAGRTVGEDNETTWVGTNLLAPRVREMGLATHHDTSNDGIDGAFRGSL